MLNQLIFVVLTLSLCAIIAPVASRTFSRNVFPSSYEELEFEADAHHELDANVGVDNKDKSEEFFYEDASLLEQQVAKADYVPPPKYAYETTNEKDTEPIKNSEIHDENGVQPYEDRPFHYDEELKTEKEREQERLRDIEAQIIPINNDKNNSPDHGMLQFVNGKPIIINDNLEEILNEPAREFEIHQNSNNNNEFDSGFGRTLEIENHQDTNMDEDLKKIADYYDNFSFGKHQDTDENGNLNKQFVSSSGFENHQNTDFDDDMERMFNFYDTL